jgi:hypothetical protein
MKSLTRMRQQWARTVLRGPPLFIDLDVLAEELEAEEKGEGGPRDVPVLHVELEIGPPIADLDEGMGRAPGPLPPTGPSVGPGPPSAAGPSPAANGASAVEASEGAIRDRPRLADAQGGHSGAAAGQAGAEAGVLRDEAGAASPPAGGAGTNVADYEDIQHMLEAAGSQRRPERNPSRTGAPEHAKSAPEKLLPGASLEEARSYPEAASRGMKSAEGRCQNGFSAHSLTKNANGMEKGDHEQTGTPSLDGRTEHSKMNEDGNRLNEDVENGTSMHRAIQSEKGACERQDT